MLLLGLAMAGSRSDNYTGDGPEEAGPKRAGPLMAWPGRGFGRLSLNFCIVVAKKRPNHVETHFKLSFKIYAALHR